MSNCWPFLLKLKTHLIQIQLEETILFTKIWNPLGSNSQEHENFEPECLNNSKHEWKQESDRIQPAWCHYSFSPLKIWNDILDIFPLHLSRKSLSLFSINSKCNLIRSSLFQVLNSPHEYHFVHRALPHSRSKRSLSHTRKLKSDPQVGSRKICSFDNNFQNVA